MGLRKRSDITLIIAFVIGILALFWLNMSYGDVSIGNADIFHLLTGGSVENSSWSYIVESRLFRSIVAVFAGGTLALSGLILQVFFRNPLAGPGVLGVTSGASLGVAVVLLGGITMESWIGSWGVVLAGIIGATGVLLMLLIISRFIKNSITLLVIGLMFGYFTSALINILFLWANESDTREYVIWGLGSFEGLSSIDLFRFISVLVLLIISTFFLIKPLNALVAGTAYASSLGIDIKKIRVLIILITGGLAAVVTVYCGPVAFIGIAVPQIIRLLIRSKNHALILPVVFLGGSFLALFADLIVRFAGNALPLNTVTALVGAPIIIWVIIKMNRKSVSF